MMRINASVPVTSPEWSLLVSDSENEKETLKAMIRTSEWQTWPETKLTRSTWSLRISESLPPHRKSTVEKSWMMWLSETPTEWHGHGPVTVTRSRLNTSYRKAHALPHACPDYYAEPVLERPQLHEVKTSAKVTVTSSRIMSLDRSNLWLEYLKLVTRNATVTDNWLGGKISVQTKNTSVLVKLYQWLKTRLLKTMPRITKKPKDTKEQLDNLKLMNHDHVLW